MGYILWEIEWNGQGSSRSSIHEKSVTPVSYSSTYSILMERLAGHTPHSDSFWGLWGTLFFHRKTDTSRSHRPSHRVALAGSPKHRYSDSCDGDNGAMHETRLIPEDRYSQFPDYASTHIEATLFLFSSLWELLMTWRVVPGIGRQEFDISCSSCPCKACSWSPV